MVDDCLLVVGSFLSTSREKKGTLHLEYWLQSDLDISHDGYKLLMALTGLDGGQSLILFNTEGLNNAVYSYMGLQVLRSILRFSREDLKIMG